MIGIIITSIPQLQENVTTDAVNSWILDVHVGASSAGDHVAFGFDDKLAILQSKYSNQQQQQQIGLEGDENCASLVTLFKDVVASPVVSRDGAGPPPPQERISCVACLPIASQKRFATCLNATSLTLCHIIATSLPFVCASCLKCHLFSTCFNCQNEFEWRPRLDGDIGRLHFRRHKILHGKRRFSPRPSFPRRRNGGAF